MRQANGPSLVKIMVYRLWGCKASSKPMLDYYRTDHKEQISVKLENKIRKYACENGVCNVAAI